MFSLVLLLVKVCTRVCRLCIHVLCYTELFKIYVFHDFLYAFQRDLSVFLMISLCAVYLCFFHFLTLVFI